MAGAANQFLFGDSDKPEMTKKFIYDVLKNEVWDMECFRRIAMAQLARTAFANPYQHLPGEVGVAKMMLTVEDVGGSAGSLIAISM